MDYNYKYFLILNETNHGHQSQERKSKLILVIYKVLNVLFLNNYYKKQ